MAAFARAAIFAMIGPPVGSLALTLVIALASMSQRRSMEGLGDFGVLAVASLLVSYVFGAAPAFLTGLVCSALRRSTTLYLAMTPLVGSALAPLSHVMFTREADSALVGMAFAGCAGGIAAAWLTRPELRSI